MPRDRRGGDRPAGAADVGDAAITEVVSLRIAWPFYWRYSKGGRVYNDGLRLIQPPDGSDERYAGSELTFDLGWRVNRSLGLGAEYSHFSPARS